MFRLSLINLFLLKLFGSSYVYAESVGKLGLPEIGLESILSFAVKGFFTIAALIALYQLVMGAFQWINSGGDKDAIESARNKIQAAVVGLILIFAVLAIGVTLEKVVFKENICFGISCDIKLPSLLRENQIDWSTPASD